MALVAIPAIIAVALVLVPLLVKIFDRNAGWPLAVTFLGTAAYVIRHAGPVLKGEDATWSVVWVKGLLPAGTGDGTGSTGGTGDVSLALRMDGLGLFFTLLALLIGAVVFIYSTRYLHHGRNIMSFYVLMTSFMLAVLLLFLADDVALLFISWELVSLASFFLIARSGSAGEAGSSRTLMLTFAGGLLLLSALGIMVAVTGTTRLSEILVSEYWSQHPSVVAVVAVLVALAAFSKSAQIPFHFWLPEAMAADTPVSAFLHAAAVVKAGIYLLLRFSGMFQGTATWHLLLIIVGMTTAVMASVYAMQKTDLKKLTAYSTVSQLGWIVTTIGVGTPFAIGAAVIHTAAHALFKSSLFMLVGVIDHQAGSRDIRRLGSLWRKLPFTFGSACIAAASMAAVPPTFGFVSKEGMLAAFEEAPLPEYGVFILLVTAGLGALATFMYSARYVTGAFIDGDTDESRTKEAEVGLWLPAALPGVLSLPIVAVMSLANHPLDEIIAATGVGHAHTHLALWHGVSVPFFISLAVLTVGVIGIIFRKPFFRWITIQRLGAISGPELINKSVKISTRFGTYAGRAANSMTPNRHVLWILVLLLTLGGFSVLGPGRLAGLADLAPRVEGIDRASDLIGLVIVALTVVSLVSTRSRLASVILLSTAGVGVSWIMLTLGAPDVALTQLLVEFCVVVLMMMVFRHQPRLYLREGENRTKFATMVATLVGLMTFAGVWLLIGRHDRPQLAMWYLDHAGDVSGAKNLVAVILVEFRAFDTLGELMVLGMAGVVIATVIRSIPKSPMPGYGPGSTAELFRVDGTSRFPDVHKVPELAPFYSKYLRSSHLNSILPRMAMYPLIPVAIIVSAVTFWRGHQEPGGGFLAALVAACALLSWYLAQARAPKIGKDDNLGYRFIGAGVLLAFVTGLIGYVKGSFLEPIHGEVAGIHLTTSLVFDAGVYLAVLGLIVVAINLMGGRDRPGAEKQERGFRASHRRQGRRFSTEEPRKERGTAKPAEKSEKATVGAGADHAYEKGGAEILGLKPGESRPPAHTDRLGRDEQRGVPTQRTQTHEHRKAAINAGDETIELDPGHINDAAKRAAEMHRAEREAAKRPWGVSQPEGGFTESPNASEPSEDADQKSASREYGWSVDPSDADWNTTNGEGDMPEDNSGEKGDQS